MSAYHSYKDGANRDIREVMAQNENREPSSSSRSSHSVMASFRQKMYEDSKIPQSGPSLFPPNSNRVNLSQSSNIQRPDPFYNPGNRPLQTRNVNSNPRKFKKG